MLRAEGLWVEKTAGGPLPLLRGIDLEVPAGQVTVLLGESGAGKTLLARALSGLLPAGLRVGRGRILFRGRPLDRPRDWAGVRGREIFYAPQNAAASFNPVLTIGRQIRECSRIGDGELEELLARLQFADPGRILRAYPFALSGGENQRCLLALALACGAGVLILDEPTSEIDAVAHDEFVKVLQRLPAPPLADRPADLPPPGLHRQGRGPAVHPVRRRAGGGRSARGRPRFPRPSLCPGDRRLPRGRMMAARFRLRGVSKSFRSRRRAAGVVPALTAVDLDLVDGQVNALVGRSGAGKSTLARIVMGFETPDSGEVLYRERPLSAAPRPAFRRRNQMVFQNPLLAVNPLFTVGQIIGEPLRICRPASRRVRRRGKDRRDAGAAGTARGCLRRLPHELSGGELQRVALARALVLEPEFLVLDEPFSALDDLTAMRILRQFKAIFQQPAPGGAVHQPPPAPCARPGRPRGRPGAGAGPYFPAVNKPTAG